MLSRAFAAALSAALLAGCGSQPPVEAVNADAFNGRETVRAILGENRETGAIPLAGARGAGVTDQNAIDRVIDAGCAIGALTQAECTRHARASAQRRMEILF